MKSGLFCAIALSYTHLISASPHRVRHAHHHRRDIVTQTSTQVVTVPDAIVFVNENGKPIWTSFANKPSPTFQSSTVDQGPEATPTESLLAGIGMVSSTNRPVGQPTVPPHSQISTAPHTAIVEIVGPLPDSPSVTPALGVHASVPFLQNRPESKSSAAPILIPKPPPPIASKPALVPIPISLPVSLPVSLPSLLPTLLPQKPTKFPLGIAYSTYYPGGCKNKEEVQKDFEVMREYGLVRLYGTDCKQIEYAVSAAQKTGKKLMIGIYDIKQLDAAISIIKQEAGDFSTISLVTVGNEEMLRGRPASEIVSAVNEAREKLKGIGYKGPVSSVDIVGHTVENPQLCQASDIATVNAQPFFNKDIKAEDAGKFVLEQVELVRKACGGKRVVVTEAGWPKAGMSNGAAVPSKENQQKAIVSLKENFKDGDMILFAAFDDKWKTDTVETFAAEQHWGMLN